MSHTSVEVRIGIPIGKDEPAEFCIRGAKMVPDNSDIAVMRTVYHEDANTIFNTLRRSLPGGTFSRLYALFVEASANDLAVATERLGF